MTSDHFVYPPNQQQQKTLKQPLQNFIQSRNGKQCIKNERLSNYIYSIAIL